jgi:hypothetical protein
MTPEFSFPCNPDKTPRQKEWQRLLARQPQRSTRPVQTGISKREWRGR